MRLDRAHRCYSMEPGPESKLYPIPDASLQPGIYRSPLPFANDSEILRHLDDSRALDR